jgi:two-component system sensor histidine kinase RegB
MGLGLFIAKTLLERSGAELSFANGRDPYLETSQLGDRTGAIVEARWRRDAFGVSSNSKRAALGENRPIEV